LKRANLHRKWSSILEPRPPQESSIYNQPSRFFAWRLFVSGARIGPFYL
jgi:hypothetical protein